EPLPVFDLGALLGHAGRPPPAPAARVAPVLVLGEGRADLGLLVDGAEEVVERFASELGPPPPGPPAAADAPPPLVRAVCADGLLILDGRALLDDPRLVVASTGGP